MTLRYVRDLAPAAWIAGRLHPFAQDVGSLVPEGFARYARVFHPAIRWTRRGDERLTWRSIALKNGRVAHGAMQYVPIASGPSGMRDENFGPPTGVLAPWLATALGETLAPYTTTPERCWFAVWEGWGGFTPIDGPRLELPGRGYFIAQGSVRDAAASVFGEDRPDHQSASMWWPDDRAWFVATEIDLDSTYVGASEAAIEALLARPDVEVLPIELSDGITYDSDRINPLPERPTR